jgi:hypothetical protein
MTTPISLTTPEFPSAILNRTTEKDTMQNRNMNAYNKTLRGLAASASALALAGLLAGCGGAMSNAGGTTGTGGGGPLVRYTGNVHGGQQPVAGSTIQLYTVGTGGLKSASAPLLPTSPAVTSDANGNFTITGLVNCASATQVYIVATQGNPGTGANSALSMMAALGPCASLGTTTTFIQINELSTVAAAYALAPFAQDYAHVGASGSNPAGLVNAFATAGNLVNISAGVAPGPTLPAGATVPATELNTLANIIAACVNSSGAGSLGCSPLFSATGATDTFGAALAIAENPGSSAVTGLYTLSNPQAPFQPSMSAQPNDFTVAINYNAGGTFATPYGIAIDATGNAWITNEGGTTFTELSPVGAVLATEKPLGLYGPQGIAVDKLGDVWVANTGGNSVIKFSSGAAENITSGGVDAPAAIALDSNNNAFVTNFNGNSVSGFTVAGAALSGSPFAGDGHITVPSGIAVGTTGAVYVTSGNGSIEELTNAGVFSNTLTDGTLQGPFALAFASSGELGATGFTTGSAIGGALGEFNASGTAGTAAAVSPVTTGFTSPAGIASDGLSFWVANGAASGSLAQFAFGSATPKSPVAGFGSLNAPVGVAVDSSGNVWTANSGSNTVSQFVGLAAPVSTPLNTTVVP